MKTRARHSAFLALIGLILSPLVVVAHTPSSPADSVHFCTSFDCEQWQREYPRPAGKRLALDVGEPRTVRMIYFLPNDRPYDAALVDLMKTRMRQIQAFYAEQMQAHGYGNRTFRFETDAAGEPLVHRVDGQHPNSYYQVLSFTEQAGLVLDEIERTFDLEKNIYFIVADAMVSNQVGGQIGRNGGFAFIPGRSLLNRSVAEHELGHAFGLNHDFRDSNYIMSYGFSGDWDELSACSARFLAVQPYFNPNAAETSPPTIELTSSLVRTADATSVPIRIKGRDSDGLHQVVLFVGRRPTGLGVSLLDLELKECRGLEGEKEAVVEFDYDGVIPSRAGSDFDSFRTQLLGIEAIDALGNVTFEIFELVIAREPRAPISTFIGRERNEWSGLFFSPDGRPLALESSYALNIDATVELWDVSTGESIFNLPPQGSVGAAAFSFDGRLLALEVLDGPAIELWDVSSSRKLVSIDEPHGKSEYLPDDLQSVVSSLSFSPDGKLLASGGRSDYMVKLWDVSSGEHVATLPNDNRGTVDAVIFSPDGKLLALNPFNDTIELWDVSSRELIATVDVYERDAQRNLSWGELSLGDLSFSPDGRLLALGLEGGPVKLWDVSTGESIAILAGSAPVSFSPDGRLLASGSGFGGQTVKLWDVSTGESIAILAGHEGYVDVVAFSPDGRLLASGGTDRTIRLWDMAEWTPIPHTLTKSSGDGQEGPAGATLAEPFVVSVLDQYGSALAGTVVSFSVTAGGGTLSATTAITDVNGRARSTLTLGSDLGTNTVAATVAGLEPETFTATAIEQTPHSLEKVSGDGQEGPANTQLDEPFVVSVLDQGGSPLAGVSITFAVTAGEGMLASTTDTNPCTIEAATSSTTATTDANGQATTRLTLGSQPGTNTVEVTVEGLEPETFTATAAEQATPHSLTKVCGDDQEGPAITQLEEPLVVFVSDADDAALAGVVVSFAVTTGGGTLSDTTVTTDANGRAATRLTLGIEAGTNAVAATVEGLEPVTFTATAEESPFASLFDLFKSGKQVALPDRPQLAQNAPNPFNSQTVFSYFLHAPSSARLEVFTLTGQRVAVLHQGPQQAGYHRLHWDGRDDVGRLVASGAYLYRLVTDETVLTRKLILLR